ncbi:hypothetical protein WM32_09090 [Burkholderia ubonensis]|uniref:hypothetical protein n=1 Tax=Burkholderia ubonensis TaxID=101571 RepID=UPI00075D2FCF|nr:hypothetical protein [Burkholderia ubonensis]KWO88591.1 hypothetical protein WM32_09090 [Burkholderia ubonensis]
MENINVNRKHRILMAFAMTFIAVEMLSLFLAPILTAVRPDLSLGSLDLNLIVGGACGAVLGLLFGIQQAITASTPNGKVWYDYI